MTVNEGIKVQEVKTCGFCGSEGFSLYANLSDRLFNAPGLWNLLHCRQCGLVWLNPRPASEEIAKIYAGYSMHDCNKNRQKGRKDILQEKIASLIIAARLGYNSVELSFLGKLAGMILSRVPLLNDIGQSYVMFLKSNRNGNLLDVGCGNGQFLRRMRSLEWQVSGVEPVEAGAKAAEELYGIRVFNGTLEQAQFDSESFDVITLAHVIEHVPVPLLVVRECCRILKPCGKLIITTPNCESLGRRVFRSAWREWDPPRHCCLFSLRTIRSLVESSGLHINVLRTTSCIAPQMWAISKSIRRDKRWSGGKIAFRLLAEGIVFWILEDAIRLLWEKAGEELLMVASKA